jgi:hypothetical protein
MAARGGLGTFNYVSRDVFQPSVILPSHAAGRPATDPTGISLDTVGAEATFSAHPTTAFGRLLTQVKMKPMVGTVFVGGRWVLAKGWAPTTEQGVAGSTSPSAAPSRSAMSYLRSLGTVAR